MEALDSQIRQVTVYRSGAVVTREVPCPAGGWPEVVVVDRLPLALDDGSVRVRFTDFTRGGPEATDVRVELWVPPLGEPVEPPSEAEVRRGEEALQGLQADLARLDEEQGYLDELELKLPPRLERKPPQAVSAQAWAGALDWTSAQAAQRDAQRGEVIAEIEGAGERLQRLQRQAELARAERGVDEDALCKRVVVRLQAGGGAWPSAMEIEYQVPGACWRPGYVLRVDPAGMAASLAVRALVCQRSGEPWERVSLAVSTADLRREIRLPELASIRIGRRQAADAPLAWREPPTGADTLFADLDKALAARPAEPAPPPPPEPAPVAGSARAEAKLEEMLFAEFECEDEPADDALDLIMDEERAMSAPPAPAMPMPQSAPAAGAPMPAVEAAMKSKRRAAPGGVARGMASNDAVEDRADEPTHLTVRSDMVDYASLRLAAWDAGSGQRGTLTHLSLRDSLDGLSAHQARRVERRLGRSRRACFDLASFPPRSRDVADTSGAYDHVYTADGPVDVPGDGAIHNVPLTSRDAQVELTLVVVPRESDQAVRVATLRNPLHAPLLEGAADIYLGGEFLVTSRVATVPAGADLDVGLGVEEALKVARNTHYEEQTAGLLKGSLALAHAVDIEVGSRLARPVQVEVRERVPIRDEDDDDIKIELGEVTPAWDDWDQTPGPRIRGGRRWRFELAPGAEQTLHYEYVVQIDGRHELVGGNRRERGRG